MATGTDSFMGKALPILGNATLTSETAADDVLTITGATSQSGDFFVCENSTGGEQFVVSSSGLVTATGLSLSGVASTASSSAANGITIAMTSTAAMGGTYQDEAIANAILVTSTSSANFNAVIMYDSENAATGDRGDSAVAFLAVNGSKAPDYLISVGASQIGLGAAADNGFVDAGLTMTADPTSDSVYAGLKILLGSKAYYILAVPDSSMT